MVQLQSLIVNKHHLTKIKFENIQGLRAVAVLFVVLYHLCNVESAYGKGNVILPALLKATNSGVDLFFVISGFIMALITSNQFQDTQKIKKFLFNRLTRIYPLYWIYSLLCLIGIIVHRNTLQEIHPGILSSFLLLPQASLPILAVGWSLIHEVYFYVFTTVILFFPKKYSIKLMCLWLLLIVIFNQIIKDKSPLITIITHPLSFEFAIGYFVFHLPFFKGKRVSILMLILGVSLLFTSFVLYSYPQEIFHTYWSRVIIFGIPSSIVLYGVVTMEYNDLKFPTFLSMIGNASYSIYLSHVLVFLTLAQIWNKIPIKNLFFHVTFLASMVAVVIIFGQFSYRYIETPLIRFFRGYYTVTKASYAQ